MNLPTKLLFCFFLLSVVLFIGCKKINGSPYVYSYSIRCYGFTQDSIKIIYDTDTQPNQVIELKITHTIGYSPFSPGTGDSTYSSYCDAELFYRQLEGTPKFVDGNFTVFVKNIRIFSGDTLLFQQNPLNIELWNRNYNEANIFLGGGIDGAYYILKLNHLYQPIVLTE